MSICMTCDGEVEYVQPAPGDYRSLGSFTHLAGNTDHEAQPKPQCPKCKSFNYRFYETNWGHGNRCGDCGYDIYYSLGD